MFAYSHNLCPLLFIKVNSIDNETKAAITEIIGNSTSLSNIDVYSYDDLMFSSYAEVSKYRKSLLWGFVITLIIVVSGLISYLFNEISKRNKEIAIRKIFGASRIEISRTFL